MKKLTLLLALSFVCLGSMAQYSTTNPQTIPGIGSELFDTLNVSGLTPAILNSTWGLDSISLNINYINDPDLTMELIAPDGTKVQLANWPGGGGSNFTGTCFDSHVPYFVGYEESAPFTGHMQPEGWIGNVNDGQNGNGAWVLHVVNTTATDTGIVLNWSLYFDSTPSQPDVFDSSTLPIIVINTNDTVPSYLTGNDVYGVMGIIDNGPGAMNHVTDAYNNYNGHIRINVRGNSSRYFPTKSYAVETEDANGGNNNVQLLGLPKDNDWILYAPWDDKSMIRDVITYQLSNEMGEYASRTRLCEVVQNGDYRGVYTLMEKIKQGSNRVNVHKMTSSDNSGANVTGGYIYEVDEGTTEGYDFWFSNYLPCDSAPTPIKFAYAYPKKADITSAQKTYIAAYEDSFETALKNTDMYDTVNGYRRYIDVPSFIDQSLLQEIGHNVDGYRLSSYIHKDKNGKLTGGPIWDFNEAFGNADYYNGSATNTFIWDVPCPFNADNLNPFWWKQFLTDSNYVSSLKCRYTELRQHVYDTVHIDNIIDSLVSMLQVPQQRQYTRWPIMSTYEWPEYYVSSSYADEISHLKGWIQQRVQWMDSSLYNTACISTTTTGVPTINQPQRIQLYPNPTEDEVYIISNGLIEGVQVYNILGQEVYVNETPNDHYTISFRQLYLSSGVYEVVLKTMAGMEKHKLVVE